MLYDFQKLVIKELKNTKKVVLLPIGFGKGKSKP